MGDKTGIEWTATVHADGSVTPGATWNPVTGCSKVSPGCAHCYAETFAFRGLGRFGHKYAVASTSQPGMMARRPFEDVRCHDDALDLPLRWRKPRRVFVNSMSDLFHEDVPDAFIDCVFAVMAWCRQHTFQVLTKRPERMREYMRGLSRPSAALRLVRSSGIPVPADTPITGWLWPLPNVWLGVSVENQRFADERIPLLLQTPAAVRFISAEPLLGPVDLSPWLGGREARQRMNRAPLTQHGETTPGEDFGPAAGNVAKSQLDPSGAVASSALPTLDWVIPGGESGAGARPCAIEWIESIVAQCADAGVACFVKQLGAWPIDPATERREYPHGQLTNRIPLHDKKGGDPSEWPADLRIREFPDCGGRT